jgi:hypothetical protein
MKNSATKSGSAILIALFFVLMATSVAGVFISYSVYSSQLTRRSIDQEKLRIAAESALDYGLVRLMDIVMYNQLTLSQSGMQALLDAEPAPSPVGSYVFYGPNGEDGFRIDVHTEPISGVITQGSVAVGSEGHYQIYTITAGAMNTNTGNSAVLQQSLQAVGLPLIRFGVFYQDDLEMNPGPNMTMAGPVHCNANMYISPGANLWFEDRVTSVGDMFRRRKDDTSSSGYVGIDNASGAEVAMTIDSRATNWMIAAIEKWDGRVLSRSHGVQELRPPIADTSVPHDIIERPLTTNDAGYELETEMEKFANKACLVVWVQSNGAFTARDCLGADMTARFTNAVLLTNGSFGGKATYAKTTNSHYRFVSNGGYRVSMSNEFWDARENCWMRPVDIYIDEFIREFPALTNTTYSVDQGRGVLYVTRDDPDGAGPLKPCVRLRNGAHLPAGGLSIASDLPVYIEGHYNISNKTTAFVAGDAVSELSCNWQDARSRSNLNFRLPSNTTYNVVILTGNSETTLGNYNGGLENVMRFLEDWSASPQKTVTFRGSIIDLWYAEIATGPWVYGAPNYTAPVRNYGYDNMYRTLVPPGMTRVFGLEETAWGQGSWN